MVLQRIVQHALLLSVVASAGLVGITWAQDAGPALDTAAIDEAIAETEDLDAPTQDGLTLLQRAIVYEWGVEAVARILEAGAAVDASGTVGYTPLLVALFQPDAAEVVEVLLEAGADTNARGPDGLAPLSLALTFARDPQVFQDLLEAGADPASLGDATAFRFWQALATQDQNALDAASASVNLSMLSAPGGTPPLAVAVRWFPDAVPVLVGAGADVDAIDDWGTTVVYTALAFDVALDVVRVLLEAGASPSVEGDEGSAVLREVLHRDDAADAIDLLVRYGARVVESEGAGGSVLREAVTAGASLEALSLLISAGADVNKGASTGGTPLVAELTSLAREGVVRLLLENGADPNDTSHWFEQPALYLAIEHPDGLGATRVLLEAGANVDAPSGRHPPALHVAATADEAAIVDLLVASGAAVNHIDSARGTALHAWARGGRDVGVLDALVRAGADVDVRDARGRTPLMIAAATAEAPPDDERPPLVAADRVASLLSVGADVAARDQDGWSALTHAADACASPETLSLLVHRGAVVDVRSIEGETPLMIVASKCEVSQVEALVEVGADVRTADARGATVLHHAALNDEPAVLAAALGGDLDVDARAAYFSRVELLGRPTLTLESSTPLIWAARSGTAENVRLLIEAGANVSSATLRGETALHFAASREGFVEAVVALIGAGAPLEARAFGYTPLMVAAVDQEDPAVFAALLEAGADVDAVTDDGQTALMLAVSGTGNEAAVSALLDAGADVDARDARGVTAFDHAHDNDAVRGTPMYWRLNDARF